MRSLTKEFQPDGAFSLQTWLNADDLLVDLRSVGIDLLHFGITASPEVFENYIRSSGRFAVTTNSKLTLHNGRLWLHDHDSYAAAAVADFLREQLLKQRRSFAVETVMSHPGKVEFLRNALRAGYHTYLYFVATQDPFLNVHRVRSRVDRGGHDVPAEKIVERYARTIALLPDAVRYSTRAFFFDNSGNAPIWLAERDPYGMVHLKVDEPQLPEWFRQTVLAKNEA